MLTYFLSQSGLPFSLTFLVTLSHLLVFLNISIFHQMLYQISHETIAIFFQVMKNIS